jgi:DNA-binding NarL/FixJ family response regulator
MPFLNGLEAAERLIKKDPKTKVIILSLHDARAYIDRAMRAGVKGYLLKENATEDIVQAIEEVHRGNFFISPAISTFIVKGFLGKVKKTKPAGDGLTSREREILQLIGEGLVNKEIAQRLYLSLSTVQVHRRNLMRKLATHKQADLIRYALKEGYAKM